MASIQSNLDQIVSLIQSAKVETDNEIRSVAETLRKLPLLKNYNADNYNNSLQCLNCQQHSMGVLIILVNKLNHALGCIGSVDSDVICNQVQTFLETCNIRHISFALDMFAQLFQTLTRILIEKQTPMRGINLLTRAIPIIQSDEPSRLTSLHSQLFELCLSAKCFKPALNFINPSISEIEKEDGRFDAKHYLLYAYYGGMILTALKRFEHALFFFEQAVTCPSSAVSRITCESHKKYMIISLILHGTVIPLPKYVSPIVVKFIRQNFSQYDELERAYGSPKASSLEAVVVKYKESFVEDDNMGLIKQLVKSFYRKKILRLTKTFVTLSLADMATRVGLGSADEAEALVLCMIEDGEVCASISHRDGMVSFRDNADGFDGRAMLARLEAETQRCVGIEMELRARDEGLARNPEYVRKCSGGQTDPEDLGGLPHKLHQ